MDPPYKNQICRHGHLDHAILRDIHQVINACYESKWIGVVHRVIPYEHVLIQPAVNPDGVIGEPATGCGVVVAVAEADKACFRSALNQCTALFV